MKPKQDKKIKQTKEQKETRHTVIKALKTKEKKKKSSLRKRHQIFKRATITRQTGDPGEIALKCLEKKAKQTQFPT